MKPYVVGIDIGGTNTVFGIVDARGNVIASSSIKTGKFADVNDYVADLKAALTSLLEAHDAVVKIAGIGVGAPNGNYFSGCIENPPNLPWKGKIPFAHLLHEAFGVPVALTNDANAAAIGEMTYGVARGMKDFIMITLGTGVGSGIVVNGQLVYGHDGFAGGLGDGSPPTAVCAVVVAADVLRLTVRLRVLPVLRASSLRYAPMRHDSATFPSRR